MFQRVLAAVMAVMVIYLGSVVVGHGGVAAVAAITALVYAAAALVAALLRKYT